MEQFPPQRVYPATAPKRTGWFVYGIIASLVLFFSVLANLVLLGLLIGGDADFGSASRHSHLQKEVLRDSTGHTKNEIAVVHLTGVISSSGEGRGDDGMVGTIRSELDVALESDRIKAIIIRINSPGGEVVASDLIYRAVLEAGAKKPVVACIDTVGASGGYYVACGAKHIIATDMSITGSIGVIMQTFTVGGYDNSLLDKIGVRFLTFKSGRYKDLLNPTRQPTSDEMVLVQNLLMEVYDKFAGIVAKSRHIDVVELKNGIADGRILSGTQAKAAGLIDQVGYFEDAIEKAKELAGITDARVVTYRRPFSLSDLFSMAAQPSDRKVQVEIAPLTNRLNLQPGMLYLLPAYLYQ